MDTYEVGTIEQMTVIDAIHMPSGNYTFYDGTIEVVIYQEGALMVDEPKIYLLPDGNRERAYIVTREKVITCKLTELGRYWNLWVDATGEINALEMKCDMLIEALQAIQGGADTCFLYLENHGAPPAVLAKVTDSGGRMQTIAALVLLEKIAYEDTD